MGLGMQPAPMSTIPMITAICGLTLIVSLAAFAFINLAIRHRRLIEPTPLARFACLLLIPSLLTFAFVLAMGKDD